MTSPVSTNNGIAIKAKELTPSNSASPISVRGMTPVEYRSSDVPSPRHTQNGTPSTRSTTTASIASETSIRRSLLEHGFAAIGRLAGTKGADIAIYGLQRANHDQTETDDDRRFGPDARYTQDIGRI